MTEPMCNVCTPKAMSSPGRRPRGLALPLHPQGRRHQTRLRAKCCARQLPRQFGEGEHGVFAGDVVPKTMALFLKRSAKAISSKEVPRLYLPPAGGGEVGGSGAGRGTRARSVCLGFPPPTCLAPLCGRSALRASPRWGEARSRDLAPRAPSGMFFYRNRLSAAHGHCPASLAGCSLAYQAHLPCVEPAVYLLCAAPQAVATPPCHACRGSREGFRRLPCATGCQKRRQARGDVSRSSEGWSHLCNKAIELLQIPRW